MNRGWFARWDLPKLRKPSEMIEADVVKIVREPAHTVDPPRISLLFHHVPAIQRIAPALAVFAEKIRRHAGDDFGIEFGVQMKQIGVGPDIGAVEIYEDRDVAHDANRMLRAISPKRLPLFEEEKLQDAADIELLEHFCVRLLDRRGSARSVWRNAQSCAPLQTAEAVSGGKPTGNPRARQRRLERRPERGQSSRDRRAAPG